MNSNLIRGSIESIVIKLITEHQEMYGYQICQKVKEITDSKVKLTEGALYPVLHKLELNGILEVNHRSVDGRVRKYYKLTQESGSLVKQRMHEMKEYLDQMALIFNDKQLTI